MEQRPYGQTDERLSIIGFGGIVVMDTGPSEASHLVSNAVDRGVNYFDVAPSYGNAEECLGPALEPFRKDTFLACKSTERLGSGVETELENSLKLLRTDHFDLYQLHGLTTQEDMDQSLEPGGALEAVLKARDKGLVRYVGFSAHSSEIAVAMLDQFGFDSVLFPINWVNYLGANFGPAVVAKAEEVGAARLALKALAKSKIPEGGEKPYAKCWYDPIDDPEFGSLTLRFALSQPITAAIPPGEAKIFQMALDLADKFTPITDDEIQVLRRKAGEKTPLFTLAT